jgi:hypothetical protein
VAGRRRNVYQGTSSCYAIKEGVWVPGSGVTPDLLPSFVALIMRDVVRGWSYDPRNNCEVIPFDVDYAISRLNYLIALATKHAGEPGYLFTREAIERLFREYRLPEGVATVRLAGYREQLDRVAKEVEDALGVRVEREYVDAEPRRERVSVPV